MMNTSKKSKTTSKAKGKNLNKPFEQAILNKAHKRAAEYHIILEENSKLGYIGSCVELPNVYVDAETPEKCYEAAKEALTVAVATMLECGQRPPVPANAKKRTLQVNVRLTPEEKSLLSNASSILGFSGLSDFIRNSALEKVSGSASMLNKMLNKV
jgi:predicted RNase H-like HicB family nuclease